MSEQTAVNEVTQLTALREELLERARAGGSRRAARTVYGGPASYLRQTLLALAAGTELAEHESPPEATLQVLSGRIRLWSRERAWELGANDLIAIPPQRHGVTALQDSTFLLTVRHDASPAATADATHTKGDAR